MRSNPARMLHLITPGILVAATGVGAGDLMTASLGGSRVGLALLWAAWVGAALKWFLNEGVARWQMATGTTLLEGWTRRLGPWIEWVFIVYMVPWSILTGGALMTACGVAGTGLWPLGDDPHTSKIIWGVLHSFAGVVLVRLGGFKLFEKMMMICIGIMFVTVVITAIALRPALPELVAGLAVPTIPEGGLVWVLGVLGGVGGTVTLLSYGYWIREKGRSGTSGVRACRIDLAVGYGMTALFGVSMIIIGSRVELSKGPLMALDLATQLQTVMGPSGKWIFLAGFWGAVFSSLLGVWQSIPYLFADFLQLRQRSRPSPRGPLDLTQTKGYRAYLFAIALVPLPVLWFGVQQAALAYAILGAMFIPLLALTLLIMNNRADWVGAAYRNGRVTNVVLVVILMFFVGLGGREAYKRVSGQSPNRPVERVQLPPQ